MDRAKTPKEDDCVEPAGGPMICGAFFWVRKSKLPFKDTGRMKLVPVSST